MLIRLDFYKGQIGKYPNDEAHINPDTECFEMIIQNWLEKHPDGGIVITLYDLYVTRNSKASETM